MYAVCCMLGESNDICVISFAHRRVPAWFQAGLTMIWRSPSSRILHSGVAERLPRLMRYRWILEPGEAIMFPMGSVSFDLDQGDAHRASLKPQPRARDGNLQ